MNKCLPILALFLTLLFAGAAHAQTRFRPTEPEAAPSGAPATQHSESSLLTEAFEFAMNFQRTMVRDIGRYMAAIRDGTNRYALWTGIGFAFLYGVLHTLGPGHGKTIVASYFVGRHANMGRGLTMGAQIAVTHVISAVLVVTVFDITYRALLGGDPIQSVWIGIVSYGIVTAIGLTMLVRAIRHNFFGVQAHHHDHDHHHGHGHQHGHHTDGHDWRHESMLAVLAGVVPCTGAILVMLFALANDIVIAGVLMVVAISFGMAVTMAGIGIASILFRRMVFFRAEEDSRRHAVAVAVLEHVAAVLILAIGLSFLATTIAQRFI